MIYFVELPVLMGAPKYYQSIWGFCSVVAERVLFSKRQVGQPLSRAFWIVSRAERKTLHTPEFDTCDLGDSVSFCVLASDPAPLPLKGHAIGPRDGSDVWHLGVSRSDTVKAPMTSMNSVTPSQFCSNGHNG